MTDKALNCSFYGNAFYAPRSISKNRKVLVVIARVNHTDKSFCFSSARLDLKPDP
jgi:hypothetical protein